jgi:predicted AlkP superfamily pyrophosphatase or phosphodiesterase
MRKTAVLLAVGLTGDLVGEHTPHLRALAARGGQASIGELTPSVTCSVQSTYLTGELPSVHGAVGNGWLFRDTQEVRFWQQANQLVQAPKVWDRARAIDPSFTVANLFWWFNMYSSVDLAVTPRPQYPADGRKVPDVHTHPAVLRDQLQAELGQFPLFGFWGPATDVKVTRWIAESAKWVAERHDPTLSLVYLPHLDYVLQREGPAGPSVAQDLRDLDAVCGDLIAFYAQRDTRVVVLSEYGIVPVSRPVHLNRVLREAGLLAVRTEAGRELLDAGASAAFAVADHQVAHVYVRDPARVEAVRELLEATPGVGEVWGAEAKREHGLDHPRSGELVAIAEPDAWLTYYHWLDDAKAPDYARTVDIHRKPGYDPVELFFDPALRAPKLKVARTLARRALGFRALMDVIPLDASLVRGSHGRVIGDRARGPVLLCDDASLLEADHVEPTAVADLVLRALSGAPVRA